MTSGPRYGGYRIAWALRLGRADQTIPKYSVQEWKLQENSGRVEIPDCLDYCMFLSLVWTPFVHIWVGIYRSKLFRVNKGIRCTNIRMAPHQLHGWLPWLD